MNKIIKKFAIIVMAMTMLIGTFALTGCSKKASRYTEAEHIQRVTERIQKRFMTGETEYTGFKAFPLYDENDKLKYFLVEFEPFGFVFILLRDEQLKGFSWLGASTSMYKLSNIYGNETWSPYTLDETNSQPYPDTEKIWELDENGDKIAFNRSPYSVAGIENERCYLILGCIAAVMQEGKFVNLISQDEVEIINGQTTKEQATMAISFIVKKQFDL